MVFFAGIKSSCVRFVFIVFSVQVASRGREQKTKHFLLERKQDSFFSLLHDFCGQVSEVVYSGKKAGDFALELICKIAKSHNAQWSARHTLQNLSFMTTFLCQKVSISPHKVKAVTWEYCKHIVIFTNMHIVFNRSLSYCHLSVQ